MLLLIGVSSGLLLLAAGMRDGIQDVVAQGVEDGIREFRQQQAAQRKRRAPIWIAVILVVIVFGGIGISQSERPSIGGSTSGQPSAYAPPSPSPRFTLSKQAEEVEQYLDEEKYNAAGRLFDAYLPEHPSDAGLMCQYVRYLLRSYGTNDSGWMSSPLRTDDRYQLNYIGNLAFDTASELDDEARPYLAEIVFSEIHRNMTLSVNQGNGFLNETTWRNGLVQLIWRAIPIAPERARAWAPRYEAMIPRFAKAGRAMSAVITGNITGDLYSGATGDSDLTYATRAFVQALEEPEAEAGIILNTERVYIELYGARLSTLANGNNSEYRRLLTKLDAMQKLQPFIDAKAVPSDLLPSAAVMPDDGVQHI